ncbi:hypothetical protein EDB84DRAFT_864451 [Lactarius hengduanensis]|nr:hypothetical protein EDB84DRAFT_864451 [Lactarius hengduanensis]
MPAHWHRSSFPHLRPPRPFAYPRPPHSVTSPSPVPVFSHARPHGLKFMFVGRLPYFLFFITPTQSLPFESGSRPILLLLVPFRWQLQASYRANTSPLSPPPLRVFVLRVALLPPRSPVSLPQAHEGCITSGNERFDPAPPCRKKTKKKKKNKAPHGFFFLAFSPVPYRLLSPITLPPLAATVGDCLPHCNLA